MSLMKTKGVNTTVFNGVQVQNSLTGTPLSIVYGTNRVPGTMVWFGDFNASQEYVGKGGKTGSGVYDYSANCIFVLCEGPAQLCPNVFDYNSYLPTGNNESFFTGTTPQAPWAWLSSEHPSQVAPYSGMAYMGILGQSLGSDATMPNLNFALAGLNATVVDNLFYNNGGGAIYNAQAWDALPSDVIRDFLTNPVHGAGWPAAMLADMVTGNASLLAYCTAVGLVISPVIDTQKSAAEWLTDILDVCNSDLVLSETSPGVVQVKVVPYGDQAVTGSLRIMVPAGGFAPGTLYTIATIGTTDFTAVGAASNTVGATFTATGPGAGTGTATYVLTKTYTPNTTPVYNFNYDDYLGVIDNNGKPTGKSAIDCTRNSQQDVYNTIPVSYKNRHALNPDGITPNAYAPDTIQVSEPVDSAVRGMQVGTALSYDMITLTPVAQHVSLIHAQRNVNIRTQYVWRAPWCFALLEPMDYVTLNDPLQGINGVVVRIISIDYPDENSEDQGITITAENWPWGVGFAATFNQVAGQAAPPDPYVAPGNVINAIVVDLPPLYSQSGEPEIAICAGGGANWGGCFVYMSLDGSTYSYIGSISGGCRYGTLSANLATSSNQVDTTNTLSVSLAAGGTFSSVPAAVASSFQNLFWVDGELISIQTATLTGPGAYNFTTLYRGVYGSPISAHSSGSSFGRLDSFPFICQVPAGLVGGASIYFKLASYNLWGNSLQDLSTLSPIAHTPAQLSYPQPIGVSFTVI